MRIGLVGGCLVVLSSSAVGAWAASTNYGDLASWEAAVSAPVTLVDFDGFADGTEAGGMDLGPGGVVQNYQGLASSPRIDNDSPFGGGWLTNRNNLGFDEFVNGIRIDFTTPVFAVSLTDNPNEANRLRLYDANDQIVGEMTNTTAQTFLGIVTDTPVSYMTVVNLPPEDGRFAIDDLRFAVPEPGSLALLGLGGLFLFRRRR
ncbi:PEP-CTERM sorting domain-containing protein [Phycisphaeraceae bacterium D3-23]